MGRPNNSGWCAKGLDRDRLKKTKTKRLQIRMHSLMLCEQRCVAPGHYKAGEDRDMVQYSHYTVLHNPAY